VLTSLSRAIWKNEERRTKRATSNRIRPATTMPISDQRWVHGALPSDFDEDPAQEAGRAEREDADGHEVPGAAEDAAR
jgi:hypothetical protein